MKRNGKLESALDRAERNRMCLWARTSGGAKLLRKRAQAGELIAVRSDLFARPAYWQSLSYLERILHVLRAVASKHPLWTFCFLSAAAIWGLDQTVALQTLVYLAVDEHTKTRNRGYLRFPYLPGVPVQLRNGLRVTGLFQTVFDCIRTLPFPEALAICDAAMRTYGISREDLERFVAERARYRGVDRARIVLAHADPLSENGGESIARAWFAIWGFAAPELQREFRDAVTGQMRRADFAWRLDGNGDGGAAGSGTGGRLILGELDGRGKYVDPAMTGGADIVDVVLAEKERESNIQLLENAVFVRIPYRQVIEEPTIVQRKLDAAGVPRIKSDIGPELLRWR